MTDTDPVERVLSLVAGTRREADGGFVARCPAHDDHKPSLRIARGDDGRCLLHCRAGCDIDSVLRSLGLQARDLRAADSRPTHSTVQTRPVDGADSSSFDTAAAAAHVYAARLGRWSRSWTYTNASGEPVGLVLRWDKPDGSKRDIRPIWRIAGRWRMQAPTDARPLFNLHNIESAPRVFVAEGEKCAELLCLLGFAATTSSGGSAAARKSEWSSLAGREVCIIPDADDAGARYAEDVRAICESLTPPAFVRIVKLSGLRENAGDDIEQWLDAREDSKSAAAELRSLADAAFAAEIEEPTPIGSISLEEVLQQQGIMDPPEVIESGMIGYDRAMPFGAVEIGTINVWGGEPGAGKSRWMLNLLWAFARRGIRVAYLFGEMTYRRHTQRLVLAQADLGNEALRSTNPDTRRRLEAARAELNAHSSLLRFVSPPLTLEKVTAAAKWADVVFIDPLQAVRIAQGRTRHEELESLFHHCIALCGEHGTVFHMNSTIAKGDDSKARGLHSAFKGGSEIEQYADFAGFLEATNEHGVQNVQCLKQRDGAKQGFTLHVGVGGWRVCTVPPTQGGAEWI